MLSTIIRTVYKCDGGINNPHCHSNNVEVIEEDGQFCINHNMDKLSSEKEVIAHLNDKYDYIEKEFVQVITTLRKEIVIKNEPFNYR